MFIESCKDNGNIMFQVSGGKTVNPLAVEDYLDYIERYSSALLDYVVNMTDMSVSRVKL